MQGVPPPQEICCVQETRGPHAARGLAIHECPSPVNHLWPIGGLNSLELSGPHAGVSAPGLILTHMASRSTLVPHRYPEWLYTTMQ